MMLGMLIFMPGICFSKEKSDSVLLNKIWSYRRNFAHKIGGEKPNVYIRYTLNTERRNPTRESSCQRYTESYAFWEKTIIV